MDAVSDQSVLSYRRDLQVRALLPRERRGLNGQLRERKKEGIVTFRLFVIHLLTKIIEFIQLNLSTVHIHMTIIRAILVCSGSFNH